MGTRALVGFDGSMAAAAAIEAAAQLLPDVHGWITYLWVPPFAGERVRRRLREQIGNVNDLIEAVDREGQFEAQRIMAMGVNLARALGWEAEPLLEQTYGSEGTALVQAADKVGAEVVVLGSRGLGGTDAILGSVSDTVVHYSSRPVLVMPHPLLSAEFESLAAGPVLVGWDGSPGAHAALAAAGRIFGGRDLVAVSVDDGADIPAPPAHSDAAHTYVGPTGGRRNRGVAASMAAAAADHGAAALVVGSRGRSAAREIILGSVAMSTLHHSHRPVMVVPNRT
jgi:nucleotide-binding universal stress UspA family protein